MAEFGIEMSLIKAIVSIRASKHFKSIAWLCLRSRER